MDKFDLIVIGTGAGTHVASRATHYRHRVALVDYGPTGGTCLNNGCIPSKLLIHPADIVRAIQEAKTVGVYASIDRIDFQEIMGRMHKVVDETRVDLEEALKAKENLTYIRNKAEFIGPYVLSAGERTITAQRIVISTGSRPMVPKIPGLEAAGYLDNITLLDLKAPPQSMIIIGAGYLGCEYAHFFSSMGTDVTIIGRGPLVLSGEDPEASGVVQRALSSYMQVITNHEVVKVEKMGGKKAVYAKDLKEGQIDRFEADEILLAAGRRSNSDILHPEKTGVETDDRGYIRVNEYLETSKKGIWALGDAIGKHMFRHTANYESNIVAHNLLLAENLEDRRSADYHAVPFAIFTHPQVAGVGMNEKEALEEGKRVLVGRASYRSVAMGIAMAEEHGFAKVFLDEDTGRILGATIVGPMASELVQQVVYLMNTESQDLMPITKSQIIHPTINEVLVRAFSNLERP